MKRKQSIILIPGLGDRSWAYYFFVWLWRLQGYHVQIFVFGWENPRSRLDIRLEELSSYIAEQKGKVSIIGVSAGGTAAVQMLRINDADIRRIVTICSPFFALGRSGNLLLDAALERVVGVLDRTTPEQKRKILSTYAAYDPRVSKPQSQIQDVRTHQFPMVFHSVTIFFALTFMNAKVRAWIES